MKKEQIMAKIKEMKKINIFLALIFLVQFLLVVYFNIKLLGDHMGYDSSWSYLKSALVWREKSLISNTWEDQTSVFFDSSMPLAAFIYGVTDKLLFSYGTANVIILVLILVMMWKILSIMETNNTSKFFALNMIVCPYLTSEFNNTNDLGYFSNLLSGPAFYNLRTLLVLMIVFEYLYIKKNKKMNLIGYISLVLCILAGTSSGIFIIVMILFPYIVYEILMVFVENRWVRLKKLESIYAYMGCFFVLLGKIISKYFLGIDAIDMSRTWTTLQNLWINIGAVIQGFMKLLGVLPVLNSKISILSKQGIFVCFPIIIFAIIVIGVVTMINKIRKKKAINNDELIFMFSVVAVNFIVFAMFNVQYGSYIFEERYLISTFMIVIIITACYINQLDTTRIFSKTIIVALAIALMANNYVSDKKYVQTTNDSLQLQEICDIVDEQNVGLIYCWGNDTHTIGRCMRVYDLNHVYKEIATNGGYFHWGDYLYYENSADYTGATLLMVPKGSNIVPENIMSQYTHIKDLNWVSIYKCSYNPM